MPFNHFILMIYYKKIFNIFNLPFIAFPLLDSGLRNRIVRLINTSPIRLNVTGGIQAAFIAA